MCRVNANADTIVAHHIYLQTIPYQSAVYKKKGEVVTVKPVAKAAAEAVVEALPEPKQPVQTQSAVTPKTVPKTPTVSSQVVPASAAVKEGWQLKIEKLNANPSFINTVIGVGPKTAEVFCQLIRDKPLPLSNIADVQQVITLRMKQYNTESGSQCRYKAIVTWLSQN